MIEIQHSSCGVLAPTAATRGECCYSIKAALFARLLPVATKQKPDVSVQALGGVVWGTDTVRGVYVVSGKAQLACECVGDPEGVDVFLIHAGLPIAAVGNA